MPKDQNKDQNPEISLQTEESKGLAGFSIRNAHLTIVCFIALVLLGSVSAYLIPKDLLPAGHTAAVQILSFYPGMPVENVEQEITFPYERYSGQAVGMKSQDSHSLTGVSIVRNYFQPNTDLSTAIAQTGSLVMSVLRKLPPGTQPPLILPFDPMASQPLAIATIDGENKSEAELQDAGRYLVTNAIQSVPGAMAPTVMGGKLRQANILLDGQKLSEFNLSPLRVTEKLEAMNSFIPAGDVNLGDFNYQLRSNAMFKSLDEINGFYLRSRFGTIIRVKDVARAEDGAARQTNIVTVNGKKQVYIPIYRQLGANSLEVIDSVRSSLQSLEAALRGYKLTVINDQTVFIRKAIDAIALEGVIGGGLAALMIYLFLGSGRATIAVLLTLPISIIGAIAVLKAFGHSLNIMSLGGLALSIGVLVDNAIVVVEVIMAKQQEGLSPKQAALIGAREVAMPVLASTVATLVVFLPVLFLKGVVETLFTSLSLAVIAALSISYYAAMMIVPLYAANFMPNVQIAKDGLLGVFQRFFLRVTIAYGKSLRWTLARSRTILKISLISHAAVAILLLPLIGTELFPRADAGNFSINLRGKTGLRVERMAELSEKVQAKLREVIPPHDLKMLLSNTGVFYGYSAAFTRNSGPQDAFINVELTEDRTHSSQEYARIIRRDFPALFPDTTFSLELGGLLSSALNGGMVSPIDVQVSGLDPRESLKIANRLLPKISALAGAVDMRIQQRFDAPVLEINMDRHKVSNFGLTPDIVVKNLVSAVSNSSSYNQQVWVDPRTGIDYQLGVQYPENTFLNREQILSIPVTSPDQERSIKLKNLVWLSSSTSATEINHNNLAPTIDIYVDSQGRDVGGLSSAIQKLVDEEKLIPGYKVDVRGEISEMKHSMSALAFGFLMAASLIYLILVAQFRSFLMPAIIMTNVPKGIVGVIIVLACTNTYFSIQAAIGCIFVIGVSVSHSVLLLEFILEKVKHSATREDGIIEASMARLRPITMTSLASILGLLPMALGLGHGAEANISLGRAVIGGQLLSTFLNFYLLPCLYHRVTEKDAKSGSQLAAAGTEGAGDTMNSEPLSEQKTVTAA